MQSGPRGMISTEHVKSIEADWIGSNGGSTL